MPFFRLGTGGTNKGRGFTTWGESVPPDETVPAAPTGLTATAGVDSITLTWTDPGDLDLVSIRVYRSLTSGSGYALLDTVAGGTETYEDTTPDAGTTYYYRLTAIDAVPNESDPSNEDFAVVDLYAEELAIGTAAYGGYVAGIIDTDAGTIEGGDAYQTGRRYMVIVAPKTLEVTVTSTTQWASSNQNLAATKSRWNGLGITEAMVAAGSQYEAAAYAAGLAYDYDGGSKWYLPAKDELELLYRNLKSGTGASADGHGVNPSSDPTGSAYTGGAPTQTSVTLFQSGNSEQFVLATNQTYMSSSWDTTNTAWCQDFGDGWQFGISQTTASSMSIRPVRRVYLDEPLELESHLFVATTGNDTTGDGSEGNPYATITKAASIAGPGTTVHVAAGTYAGGFTTAANGAASAHVKYVSTTPHGAKIDAGGSSQRVWTNDGDYVEIHGFEITNGIYIGILNNGHTCLVKGNWIHDLTAPDNNGGNGGAFYTENGTTSHDNVVDGNLCHGNLVPGGSNQNHGIYLAGPDGTARNNIVYDVSARGVQCYHDPSGATVVNNLIFACGTGVLLNGESTPIDNCLVANNIILDCNLGIHEETNSGSNNDFLNNLLFGNTSNSVLANGTLVGTVTSDPLMVDYQEDGSGDYHLTSSSPAVGAGTATGAPTTDYDGVTRGSPPDIGPFEYVA